MNYSDVDGTEIRNPQGECLSEGYRYHTDCPSTNHNGKINFAKNIMNGKS